jgi:hypothetical protein
MTDTDRDVPLPEEAAANAADTAPAGADGEAAPAAPPSLEEQLDASLDVLEVRVDDARRFLAAWRAPDL